MIWLVMKPRDTLGPTDEDYDETYDYAEDSYSDFDFLMADDELKLKLDIQEVGLSDERILKYSVRQRQNK